MSSPRSQKVNIVIVGAGMAGLSAAVHLAEQGLKPLVLEADADFCGGRVAGAAKIELAYAGQTHRFRDEHGVHGIWSPYINLNAMLTRYEIRPMFVPAQEENWVYKRGGRVLSAATGSAIRHSWVPAPLHYLTLFLRPRFLGMLGLRDWLTLPRVWYSLAFCLGIDPLSEGQPLQGLWLSDFIRGWSPALRAFFVGLARNALSARPEEIPLSGFIAFLRFYTLRRRDAWAFSYMPTDGGTSLIDPLVNVLQKLGGSVKKGCRVTHLEPIDRAWRIHWQSTDKDRPGSILSDQIILATDASNTREILDASAHISEQAVGFYWPRAVPTAVIRLWFDRAPLVFAEAGIFSGEFVIDNFFWLHLIQNAYIDWHRATGGSAIEVHIYGPPELLDESDTILLTRAIADVNSAFPELRGHLIHQFIRRNDATHTLFGVGPQGRHLGIETPWPDIFCCGDWVYHPSPSFFLERACVTGIEAANRVLASHNKPVWPLLNPLPPERLVALIERIMLRGRRALRRRGKHI